METKHHNGKEIYQFSSHLHDSDSNTINKLSLRLVIFIGINIVMLIPILQLSDTNRLLILSKAIALISLSFSLFFCFYSLKPMASGSVYTGQALADNLWDEPDDVFYLSMIDQFEKSCESMGEVVSFKQQMIKQVLIADISAILFCSLNILFDLMVKFLDTL